MPLDPSRRPLLFALAATLACGTISSGRSLAGPLDLDALPAATTAVVHVDVEAMMQSDPLRRAAAESLQTWAKQLPIDLQKDVLDATAIDDMQGYRIRLSPTARGRIEDFLSKLEPDQVRLNYGKHVIHVSGGEPSAAAKRRGTGKKRTKVPQVEDGEGIMVFQFGSGGVGFEDSDAVQASAMPTFASFLDDQTLLVANDVRSLTRLLDVADGKTPSLADKGGDVWKTRAKAPDGTWITSIGLGNFLQGGAANTGVDGPLAESVASLTRDIARHGPPGQGGGRRLQGDDALLRQGHRPICEGHGVYGRGRRHDPEVALPHDRTAGYPELDVRRDDRRRRPRNTGRQVSEGSRSR